VDARLTVTLSQGSSRHSVDDLLIAGDRSGEGERGEEKAGDKGQHGEGLHLSMQDCCLDKSASMQKGEVAVKCHREDFTAGESCLTMATY